MITEPLRLWLLKPRLAASFAADEHCLRETPIADGDFHSVAKVARFLVKNERRFSAKNARAYLTPIEKRKGDGSFTIEFADRLPLRWAYIGAVAIDIPGKTQVYCDVAGAAKGGPSLIPHTEPRAQLFNQMFDEHTVYRFTAIVTADNVIPTTMRLLIHWKGDWNLNFADVRQDYV